MGGGGEGGGGGAGCCLQVCKFAGLQQRLSDYLIKAPSLNSFDSPSVIEITPAKEKPHYR